MASATNDISERYLKRAIAEINDLGSEIAHAAGPERAHVLGSGHPLADIFMLKHTPQPSELQEGVAFFGRTGEAMLKSIQRLRIDPMAIYGTNVLKIAGDSMEHSLRWLTRELHVVQPKVVVIMGTDARTSVNDLDFPLSAPVSDTPGEIQRFTPTIGALVTPGIDESLDQQDAMRAFWEAFKALGQWWSELPPY
ncbi:MAG: uracil-DNA glycosylase family protein [Gaiellales bacterium]